MNKNELTLINFRDMGGLATADNKSIKQGMLFRTAVISPKTKTDFEYLNSLRLDTVIDLRTPQEIAEAKDNLPPSVKWINANVFDDPRFASLTITKKMIFDILKSSKETVLSIQNDIISTYEIMPFRKEAYAKLFEQLDYGKRVAFHCTAGKDRTGIAAMMIELSLGRDLEQCREQYLFSNIARAKYNEKLIKKLKMLLAKDYVVDFFRYALTTCDECFDRAIDTITAKYGSMDNFLLQVYDITPDRKELWKSFYLTDKHQK